MTTAVRGNLIGEQLTVHEVLQLFARHIHDAYLLATADSAEYRVLVRYLTGRDRKDDADLSGR